MGPIDSGEENAQLFSPQPPLEPELYTAGNKLGACMKFRDANTSIFGKLLTGTSIEIRAV